MSVSAVRQRESAIPIYTSCLFGITVPLRSLQSTEQSSLCSPVGSHKLFILYKVVYVCQSQSPSLSHPPAPVSLGVHTPVLYVRVSISVLQIRSYIPFSLDSTYMP